MNEPIRSIPQIPACSYFRKTGLVLAFLCMVAVIYPESVAHRFNAKERNKLIENILYLAAGTGLSGMGFSSTRTERNSGYVLVTEYEQREENIAVSYTLLDSSRTPVARRNLLAPLDHQIDMVISNTLRELFEDAQTAATSTDSAGITDLFSWRQDASGPIPKNARSAPAFVFESGAEAIGVIFFGDMAEYVSFGAGGSILAGATWRRDSWRFTAGVKAGTLRAFRNDEVTGPDLLISTGGLFVMYGTGARILYRIAGTVSAGTALLTLFNDGPVRNKTVPYADAGISALLPAGKYFYYGAKLSFLTVFDPDSILTCAGVSILCELEL